MYTIEDFMSGKITIKVESDDNVYYFLDSMGVRWRSSERTIIYMPHDVYLFIHTDGTLVYQDSEPEENIPIVTFDELILNRSNKKPSPKPHLSIPLIER